MSTVRQAMESGDFERFIGALDRDAVWVRIDPLLPEGDLHQVCRIEGNRIVRLEDYAGRKAALAGTGR